MTAHPRRQRHARRAARFANSFGLLGDNMAKLPRCADTAAMIAQSVEYMDRVHPGMRQAMTVLLSNSFFGKFGAERATVRDAMLGETGFAYSDTDRLSLS